MSSINQKKKTFTSSLDLDLEILTKVNDKNLYNIFRINKYFFDLNQNENLWRNRINRYFPNLTEFKKKKETWKDFYLLVRTFPLDSIIKNLIKEERIELLKFFINKYNLLVDYGQDHDLFQFSMD